VCVLAADPVIGPAVIFIPGRAGERSNKMDIRVYVGNLAKSTTQDEINTLFAQAGTVSSVDLVKDRVTGLSKGFAFVSMASQAEADKAISMFNAYSLAGSALKVNIAKPRV
jgi:cold-inducible RNA-binding protein